MSTKRRTKLGIISMQRPDKGVMKKWKPYKFNVTAMYLLYFKTENMYKPDGQILLTSITKLETDHCRDASYPVQVYFKGKAERGPGSPWVLDLSSNEERIEWMEAILPGSSEYLRKFSKQGSLHRTMPVSGSENPYSLAGHDSTDYEPLNDSQQGMEQHSQPSNYIDPVSMGKHKDTDQSFSDPPGVRSECVHGNSRAFGSANLSLSADSTLLQAGIKNAKSASGSERVNSRQAHNRATFTHADRGHQPLQLSRSLTEREMNKSPEHHYELDVLDSLQASRPPLPGRAPPTAKPRVKRPPPRLRNGSGSLSDSQSVSSPSDVLSPNEIEPCTHGPNEQTSKEAEYDIPTQPAKPAPAPRRTAIGDSPHLPNSTVKNKPPITPRKTAQQGDKSSKQSDYLHLLGDNETGVNGSVMSPVSQPHGAPPGFSEEMIQNFTPNQLNMLIKMLQQVQSNGGDPQVTRSLPSTRSEVSSATLVDNKHMKKQFERAISYTPQLQTEKILVIDGEDGQEEGYEARPDWAKAVSAGKSGGDISSTDTDILSDLQEEALYIPRSRVTDFTVIGEGQFGKVFRAVMQRGSEPIHVAVKTAKKSTTAKEKGEFLREMNIMSRMVHPNIVQLYGVIRDDVPAPWIVLEYLQHGDIKSFLIKNSRPVERLVKYMIDVSMGMHYLSERGLVHRDLAARNVLIGENETCKVSDFGLLRELPKDESIYCMQTNVPCPVRWMPPESIEERKFSPASDVWSFGILLWEMFYPHKTPYENLGNIEVAMKVIKGHRLEVPPRYPPVVGRIMKACWHQKPDKRPSFLLISTLLTTKVNFPSE